MGTHADISRTIIEALYEEALLLADEVRATFDLSQGCLPKHEHDFARIALSVEGLRTTTRVMHALAWLLNRRAHFNGEMSEFQLRRYGTLPPDRPADPDNLCYLPAQICDLIRTSERLHARIARLDRAWRDSFEMRPAAVLRLRERLGRAVGET
ncbi:DUF1465 family protein [Pelagerythrobacter marensis]|uniref:DUF1465 family protein n=1 Tax=Pelagerythrobacter marensis TaxID=543877 RepID=A0ABZ2D0N4_9SPHN